MLTLRSHKDLDEVSKWIRNNSTECLIVTETATRDHIHALFIPKSKTIDSFRKQFKKNFPSHIGNQHYSLKDVKSEIGIKDYLCKGETRGQLPIVLQKSSSWTDAIIQEHHDVYWSRHETEEEANAAAKKGSDAIYHVKNSFKPKLRQQTSVEKITARIIATYGEEEVEKWTYNEVTKKSAYIN